MDWQLLCLCGRKIALKNFKYKVLISILVFILVAVVTIVLTRVTEEERSGKTVMTEAALPIVYMVSESGTSFNPLHGYVANVDESMLHECITPLPEGRKLTIGIGTYGQKITGISYEIRSLDGEEYLENTTVTDYNIITSGTATQGDNVTGQMGERIEAVLNIKNLLKDDTEYMMKINVSTDKETASYYTRIILGDGLSLDEKLDYVLHFSEVTYDDEAIKEIIPKLETNSSGDNTNLGHVNIHSKLSQVGWGSLSPEYYGDVWPTVVEIQGNTADIRLDYQVSTQAARGIDIYDVTEFFRIRRADAETTYVLGYDRYVDQVFDGLDDLNDSGRIYLGITSGLDDGQLTSDTTGRVTCFVRRGELWSYNAKSNQFVQIFTFADDDSQYDSVRETYGQHGIKVLSVNSDGSVSFVVYGYMNRGSHEGRIGISVCQYDAEKNSVDEILYVPRNDIYEVIEKDVETLAYLNGDGRFFMYQGGSIYSIYYDTKEYMVVSSQVIEDSCFFSEKYSMFVYQEGTDAYKCDAVDIIYLDTGETDMIEAEASEYIKTLGLIDGNIIYGRIDKSDVTLNEEGESIYPMYRLEIADGSLNVIKDYEKNNLRVMGIETDSNKIVIKRCLLQEDGSLEETGDDQLMSTTVTSDDTLTTKQVATQVRQKELYIMLTVAVPSADAAKVVYPKSVSFNGEAEMYMSEVVQINEYYRVYGMGELMLMTKNLGEAIVRADELAGVVVSTDGAIVWNRYKKNTATVALNENYRLSAGVRISGVSLDEALYYIDAGKVLKAKVGDEYAVIYAYDKNNVSYMTESGSIMNTRAEMEAAIQESGRVIYVCDVE